VISWLISLIVLTFYPLKFIKIIQKSIRIVGEIQLFRKYHKGMRNDFWAFSHTRILKSCTFSSVTVFHLAIWDIAHHHFRLDKIALSSLSQQTTATIIKRIIVDVSTYIFRDLQVRHAKSLQPLLCPTMPYTHLSDCVSRQPTLLLLLKKDQNKVRCFCIKLTNLLGHNISRSWRSVPTTNAPTQQCNLLIRIFNWVYILGQSWR